MLDQPNDRTLRRTEVEEGRDESKMTRDEGESVYLFCASQICDTCHSSLRKKIIMYSEVSLSGKLCRLNTHAIN